MEFVVMTECKDHCEDWEGPRETYRTTDAVEAIEHSKIYRDQTHSSWVEIVK